MERFPNSRVPPAFNLPSIRAALAGNATARIVERPGRDHLLQPAKTGLPQGCGAIPSTIDPQLLDVVRAWLAAAVRR